MADSKDSTMKLFGKTFSLRLSEESSSNDEQSASISIVDSEAGESCSDRKVDGTLDEENKENSVKDPNSESSSKSEVSENQTLKKPEKIVPCPRCNSMETKFCYFNNYNVNQPRHFCKNCQRYWTAGGTMRNVPVGAGRRKNKNSAAANHYRHLIIPESLQTHPAGILTFGSSDCDNQSSSSSVTASNSSDHHHQAPASFPSPPPPWPYWAPQPAPPGFCHSAYPVSFYPAGPFWGAGPWTAQHQGFPEPTQKHGILGKRSRVDGEVLMPKTLRIDDPAEAAKSSIWATLGISNEKTGSSGMFEPFQSKSKGGDDKSRVVEISPAMHANPAAMSRSLRFLESA